MTRILYLLAEYRLFLKVFISFPLILEIALKFSPLDFTGDAISSCKTPDITGLDKIIYISFDWVLQLITWRPIMPQYVTVFTMNYYQSKSGLLLNTVLGSYIFLFSINIADGKFLMTFQINVFC